LGFASLLFLFSLEGKKLIKKRTRKARAIYVLLL
jgi:hypothetical protein